MTAAFVQGSPNYPAGTVLRAYDKRFFAGGPPERGQGPSGPEVASATVLSLGGATFEGLEDEQTYYIGGQVSGVYRWIVLRMPPPSSSGGTTHGIPSGGLSGDRLTKTSGADFAVGWVTPVTSGITIGEADERYVGLLEKRNVQNITADTVLPAITVATIHVLTIKAAAPKLTLPVTVAGASITVYIVQDTSGSRAPTFAAPSGSIRWPEGTLPSFSPTANAVDALSFLCADGSHWDGFVAGYALK